LGVDDDGSLYKLVLVKNNYVDMFVLKKLERKMIAPVIS